VGPVIIGFTAFLIVSSLFLKTVLAENIGISDIESLIFASLISIIVGIIGVVLLRKIDDTKTEDYSTVEGIFRKLQIITSCYVAFAHGANDVANAIGPIASIVPLAQ
jgi:PiT family inorganic phosphate transporter